MGAFAVDWRRESSRFTQEPDVKPVWLLDLEACCLAVGRLQRPAVHDLHCTNQYPAVHVLETETELLSLERFVRIAVSAEARIDIDPLADLRSLRPNFDRLDALRFSSARGWRMLRARVGFGPCAAAMPVGWGLEGLIFDEYSAIGKQAVPLERIFVR